MTTAQPSASADERGFITITTVLILVAVGLATSLELLGGVTGTAGAEAARREALGAAWLADACAERARAGLRAPDYAGDETLELGTGTCEVLPLEATATASWRVRAVGRMGEAFARTEAEFEVAAASGSPATVTELSWQRVADF